MNYSAILTEAKSELSSLESKVEKLKRFILSLESLADTENFDPSKPVTTGQRKTKEAPGFIKDDSLDMFRIMLSGPKSIDAILDGYRKFGYNDVARKTLVTRLSYYKRDFGFVRMPAPGMYEVTEKGREFLQQRYPKVFEPIYKQEPETKVTGSEEMK